MSTRVPVERPGALRRRTGWVVAALAAALALVAAGLAANTLVWSLRAAEANGEVIALEAVRGADGQVRVPAEYHAVIEFPDHNGQFRRFTDPSTTGTPPAIGSGVKVLFDRKRPAKARLEDLPVMYHDAVLAGAWALALGVVAEELVRGARPGRPRVRDLERDEEPGVSRAT